jgi:hypothetical protein
MITKRVKYFEEERGENGGVVEVELDAPAHWEICSRCSGNGTHVNPNIDGNGITSSEWAEWDEDEREGYFSGRYDVQCEDCSGSGKILEIDHERFEAQHPAAYAIWNESEQEDESFRQMWADEAKWERRMMYGSDD